jgi:hypothetical protein
MPAILHLLRLIAIATLDTDTSAEQDDVVYHYCLLEKNWPKVATEVCLFPSSHDLRHV